MLSGLIERWAFARRFVPYDGGYLFRPSFTAPAYWLSEEERAQSIAAFRQHRRWRSLKLIGIVIVLLGVLGSLAIWLDVDSSGQLPWWVTWLCVVAMMLLYWRQYRRESAIPMAIIGNREPVSPAQSWLAASSSRLVHRSWPVHLAVGAYIAGLGWLFYPRATAFEHFPWYPWVYGLVAALLVAQWLWITWAKATRSADYPPA